VEVTLVELKDIQLPDSMKRAMARQAEAEREKRAKIINAEVSRWPLPRSVTPQTS
jgi:regulator of protease activity HflC (stomatin/prohibitin superfamily)